AGLGQGGLDHQVVERDRLRELGPGPVAAKLGGYPVKRSEYMPKSPGQVLIGSRQSGGVGARVHVGNLSHETGEQDRVPCFIGLLGGQEILLLLLGRGVDEGREVVGYGVLAVEEHRVGPEGGAPLELVEVALPLLSVDRE